MKWASALFITSLASFGQMSSVIGVSNGVELQINADLGQPTGQEQLTVQLARASGDSFYRIFWDQNHLAVFAYELKLSLVAGGLGLTATAKPVETEFAARYANADAGKPVPTLSADQTLGPMNSGESALLPLFEIPGMGIKLTDTLRVKLNTIAVTAGDGSLHVAGLRVSLNGKPISGAPPPASVTGKYVMIYIPGSGGYFFSLEPVTGYPFVNSGTIDGRRLHFSNNNVDFDCTASEPILVRTQATGAQVWVYNDPAYVPEGNWTQDPHTASSGGEQFFMAASDSLGWWLP